LRYRDCWQIISMQSNGQNKELCGAKIAGQAPDAFLSKVRKTTVLGAARERQQQV
jgi:hypothetical protein